MNNHEKQTFALFVCLLFTVTLLFADNPHVPRGSTIVADITISSQTTEQVITLLTPVSDGTFRVSVYAEMFGTPSNSTQLGVFLSWTDDVQTESTFTAGGPASAEQPCTITPFAHACSGTALIHAKAGTAITVDFGQNGNLSLPPGGTYTGYVLVEQL